jgi:hypothetical protein
MSARLESDHGYRNRTGSLHHAVTAGDVTLALATRIKAGLIVRMAHATLASLNISANAGLSQPTLDSCVPPKPLGSSPRPSPSHRQRYSAQQSHALGASVLIAQGPAFIQTISHLLGRWAVVLLHFLLQKKLSHLLEIAFTHNIHPSASLRARSVRQGSRKLKGTFRGYRSQPLARLIEEINPILHGWVQYFAIGHSSRCFSYIRDWVEKKIRRHLGRARQHRGFGWKRWSKRWLYERVGLFNGYRLSRLPASKAAPV